MELLIDGLNLRVGKKPVPKKIDPGRTERKQNPT